MTTSLTDDYIGMLIDTSMEILFWGHSLPDGEVYSNILKKINNSNLISDASGYLIRTDLSGNTLNDAIGNTLNDSSGSISCQCFKRELHTEIVYGLIKLFNQGEGFVYAESVFWVLFAEALSRVDIVHCGLILQAIWTGDTGWLLGGFLRLLMYNNYPSRLDDPGELIKFVTLCTQIISKRRTHDHHVYTGNGTSHTSYHDGHNLVSHNNNFETMDSILGALVNTLNSDMSTLSDNEKNIVELINQELSNLSSNSEC